MNSPHDAPTREEGFRMVREREALTEETEFWCAFQKQWGPISPDSVDYVLDKESVGRFRVPTK